MTANDDGAPQGGPFEWWQRAQELMASGDNAAAAVLLERAVREAPSASGWEALGRTSYDSGQFQRAAQAFTELLELSPANHYGHFALGLTLTRLGRFEVGVEHLAMAAAMAPYRPEYVERLRQARATVAARRLGAAAFEPGAPDPSGRESAGDIEDGPSGGGAASDASDDAASDGGASGGGAVDGEVVDGEAGRGAPESDAR